MAEAPASGGPSTPTVVVPMKRAFEDDHTPSVSSPLNPDAAARGRASRPSAREPREKKDSLKKRESVGGSRSDTPDESTKKRKLDDDATGVPSPTRYNHPLPREPFHYTIRDQAFASQEPEPLLAPDGTELKKPVDHAENKKGYRYTRCIADPLFSHIRYYRACEGKPYGPRMSLEDSDKWFRFDESAKIITNEKGWRMGRANICAREGSFYYEVKILRGVRPEGSPVPPEYTISQGPLPHVRMGWARREAPLDAPVGFDGYSYGLTDIRLEPMHKSRASKFLDDGSDRPQPKKPPKSKSKSKQAATLGFSAEENAREGDVIGLEISLPSISLHRKIVDGHYNPAVDVGSGLDEPTVPGSNNSYDPEDASPNIVRDRFPVPYKGAMYFESMEYRPSKAMEAYGDRGPISKETPSPNHPDPSVRCLPHSHIKIYKNGRKIGTAFRNLMAFLPPASQSGQEKGVRAGCDDGMLGYFPAVSAFAGGIAEVNFGPDFWCPPAELGVGDAGPPSLTAPPLVKSEEDVEMGSTGMGGDDASRILAEEAAMMEGRDAPRTRLRAVSERYTEQIAEDMYYDMVDEVDFFVQDSGEVGVD